MSDTPSREPDVTRWMGSQCPPCDRCSIPITAGEDVVVTTFWPSSVSGNWTVRHAACEEV